MKKCYYGQKFGKLTVIDEKKVYVKEKVLCECECGNKKYVIFSYLKNGTTKSCGCLRKPEDLTGKTFGRLTVIKHLKIKNRTMCLCKCSCGNTKNINASDLRSGRSKSCGCFQRERASEANKLDLTGRRFGRLKVLFYSGHIGVDRQWKCKCDCGNVTDVRTSVLLQGKTKSCGCLVSETVSKNNTKDLSGKRFGKLVAVSKQGFSKRGCVIWKCICDCGNECFVDSGNLMCGYNSSCGCIRSKAETICKLILKNYKIEYVPQKTFEGCTYKGLLLFDVYIPSLNLCIELDGKQHFEINEFFGGEEGLKERKIRDKIKTKYCKENNIKLLRIPYTKFDNIEEVLRENNIIS